MRDICRWHVEEFAHLMAKLKSMREGEKTLLESCCIVFVHEHAEANDHKNNGLAVILAGHAGGRIRTGEHTKTTGTIGELYLTLANDVMGAGLDAFPTAQKKLSGLLV
jgi:hypothetical protein